MIFDLKLKGALLLLNLPAHENQQKDRLQDHPLHPQDAIAAAYDRAERYHWFFGGGDCRGD